MNTIEAMKILGLSSSIKYSEQELKSAYRKCARKYHPDMNSDDNSHVMFERCNEAYELLKSNGAYCTTNKGNMRVVHKDIFNMHIVNV